MPAMSAELHIALLGRLSVTLGGQELPDSAWRSRQERRLLLILLAARGARVPVDRLLDWLWPGADQSAGATTLRSAISGLRHTLEHESGARASSRYILTRAGGYAWNTESGAWVDSEEFLALTDPWPKGHPPLRADGRPLAQRAPPAPGSGTTDDGRSPQSSTVDVSSRIQNLERAIALYRGDYLADESDVPWAAPTREALRERFLSVLHELAELRLAAD